MERKLSNVLGDGLRRGQIFLIPASILVLLVSAVSLAGAGSNDPMLKLALVNLVLVLGFYLFVGNSGIVSFGHMAFMAVGAYTAALTTMSPGMKSTLLPDLPTWLQRSEVGFWGGVGLAALVAGSCALLLGPILMRLSGLSAGIATLALVLSAQVVITESEGWTRGSMTLVGIPNVMSLTKAILVALAVMFIVFLFQVSKTGLLLRAVRDDELAAQSIGLSRVGYRTVAFVLSAALCGVGGALLAFYQQSLSPSLSFFLTPTFIVVVMLVVGGMRSLGGAFVGALLIAVLNELLRRATLGVEIAGSSLSLPHGSENIVLGVLTLLFLMKRPQGLMGSREFRVVPARKKRLRSTEPGDGVSDRSGRQRQTEASHDSGLDAVRVASLRSVDS